MTPEPGDLVLCVRMHEERAIKRRWHGVLALSIHSPESLEGHRPQRTWITTRAAHAHGRRPDMAIQVARRNAALSKVDTVIYPLSLTD